MKRVFCYLKKYLFSKKSILKVTVLVTLTNMFSTSEMCGYSLLKIKSRTDYVCMCDYDCLCMYAELKQECNYYLCGRFIHFRYCISFPH